MNPSSSPTSPSPFPVLLPAPPLSSSRYNRQLLVPQLRLTGQQNLLSSRVLIVGLGGLGSPAALYLAGAGIGTLGLMDADTVDVSNLHRQIAHTEAAAAAAQSKVSSALERCRALNSTIEYRGYEMRAGEEGGAEFLRVLEDGAYQVVLDCTDNPATRYLISDACVVAGCVLVSGAAQRGEGQVVVLNCPPKKASAEGNGEAEAEAGVVSQGEEEKGPCYRCVFPRPPPPEMVRGCSEIGILGHVVGVIGTLMAGEAVKLISQGKHLPPFLSTTTTATTSDSTPSSSATNLRADAAETPQSPKPKQQHTMLLYNTFAADPRHQFRTITLRGRRKDCVACGDEAVLAGKNLTRITRDAIAQGRLDYVAFCGVFEDVKLLGEDNRVEASAFLEAQRGESTAIAGYRERDEGEQARTNSHKRRHGHRHGGRRARKRRPIIVDVREEHEFELGAKVRGSVNIPISRILRHGGRAFDDLHSHPQYQRGDVPDGSGLSDDGEGRGGGMVDQERHIPVTRNRTLGIAGAGEVWTGRAGGMVDEESHIPVRRNTGTIDGVENENGREQRLGGMVDEESHIPVQREIAVDDRNQLRQGGMIDQESHIPVHHQNNYRHDQAQAQLPRHFPEHHSFGATNDDAQGSQQYQQGECYAYPEENSDDDDGPSSPGAPSVYFVCQRGNDSQIAAQKLLERIQAEADSKREADETSIGGTERRKWGWGWVGDVKGGFVAMERHEFGTSSSTS